MSVEYNRRHYGEADEEPEIPRVSKPANLGRFTGANVKNDPYVAKVTKEKDERIRMIPVQTDTLSQDWRIQNTTGRKTVKPSDLLEVHDESDVLIP